MKWYLSPVFTIIFFIVAIFILPKTFEYSFTKILGSIFIVGGFLLWIIAHLQLGECYSVLPKAKKLVTEGVYSRIKHPIYLGISLILIGATIYSKSLIWLMISILGIIMNIYLAKGEGEVLERKFGKIYKMYKNKTWL